ncbi:MAG TPA: MBL fold metallo-hydrolase [Candidatus Dormibacteraeota bacterium]|jgi:glyoxylase-like metal-dependent hydrolase (beta-lactamase superfamily II)
MAQPVPAPESGANYLIRPEEGVSHVSDDIVVLSCPVPFDVGSVNVYLLLGDPLTMIDTGSRINFTIEDLTELARRGGVDLADIQQLILTHRHIDHFGLGRDVQERSGCTVVSSTVDGPFMAEWEGMITGSREQLRGQGVAFGIPEDLFQLNERWVRAIVHAAAPVKSDRLVKDGDIIQAGGRTLRVIETPGHTEGLIGFVDDANAVYLANDHILKHITPNPDVYSYNPDHLKSGLPDYVRSLHKVRDLPVRLVLPGHGYEMTDLKGRVDDILEHHEVRAAKVEGILAERARTIYEVCQVVWPNLRAQDAHLAVREIVGHIALLQEEKKPIGRTTRADGALLWHVEG